MTSALRIAPEPGPAGLERAADLAQPGEVGTYHPAVLADAMAGERKEFLLFLGQLGKQKENHPAVLVVFRAMSRVRSLRGTPPDT